MCQIWRQANEKGCSSGFYSPLKNSHDFWRPGTSSFWFPNLLAFWSWGKRWIFKIKSGPLVSLPLSSRSGSLPSAFFLENVYVQSCYKSPCLQSFTIFKVGSIFLCEIKWVLKNCDKLSGPNFENYDRLAPVDSTRFTVGHHAASPRWGPYPSAGFQPDATRSPLLFWQQLLISFSPPRCLTLAPLLQSPLPSRTRTWVVPLSHSARPKPVYEKLHKGSLHLLASSLRSFPC
jgi:hypothetical protein